MYPVIIPARSGSKGIKGKNIIEFCGKPLLAWSIIQAKKCDRISNVYVSTDGDEISRVAKEYGAVVIHRPQELATDISSSEEALLHAIWEIEKKEEFHSAIFLQATSPVRRKEDIGAAIEVFERGNYDSLFSMWELKDCCLWKETENQLFSYTYDYKKRGRRQERDPLYMENGSLYIFSKELLLKEKNRLGGKIGMYGMPMECSFEIDEEEDIPLCEYFMESILKKEAECK